MSRVLVGTVRVLDGQTVCVRPDGRVHEVGGKVSTFPVFGGLRPYDEGKQIWRVAGVTQMENDSQRDRRLGR
ncbi:hypothetical protein BAJUN_01800 [Bajunvirus bajun]|uniref:Uncharacterized protein n=1 Tax=Brevundimonas phage vB_BgoS-Bajun TaxID=2948594 RepID=A0A9E7SU56_9CAUD|nr:hypothetical protein BAJUN_01800 [Brevundimonas phage vB_BgoS-Bajun]